MASITCAGCKHSYTETALYCPNCGRAKAREQVADPLVGKILGERFQIQELIGQGGSGTIYRAEHVTLRRKVGIKVLHNELSRDDLAVERFRREATTVAEIDNEHIVEIHDFGRTADGRLYLAMELLEGETLDSVLAREKQLSVERVGQRLADRNDFRERQRPAAQAPIERLALEQLHREIGGAGRVAAADVEDRADVRVAQRRDRARLASKAFDQLGRRVESRRKHLDRDEAIQPRVASPVHFSHAACTERLDDVVGSEPHSRHCAHSETSANIRSGRQGGESRQG